MSMSGEISNISSEVSSTSSRIYILSAQKIWNEIKVGTERPQ